MDDPFLGKKIDEYTLDQLFAQGGQGNIYTVLEYPNVLLKIFHNMLAMDRAQREIEALKRLQHPGFVKIIKSGIFNGYPYFSMEQISGKALRDVCEELCKKKQILSLSRSLGIAWRLADAMSYAHDKGIVHRDLKPENIIICADDRPVIIDLGLVKQSGSRTLTSSMIGTPLYMAPEQIKTMKGDEPPIDVYALGIILYELLTDHWPLAGRNVNDTNIVELYNMILHVPPRDPREYVPDIPENVVRICFKCLEKDPAKRYPTAEGLRADLWPELLSALKNEARRLDAEGNFAGAVATMEKAISWRGYDATCGHIKAFFEEQLAKKLDIYFVADENQKNRLRQFQREVCDAIIPVLHVSASQPYIIMERAVTSLARKLEEGYLPLEEEVFTLLARLRKAAQKTATCQLTLSLSLQDIGWNEGFQFSLMPAKNYIPLTCSEVLYLGRALLAQLPPVLEGLYRRLAKSEQTLEVFWEQIEIAHQGYRQITEIEEALNISERKSIGMRKLLSAVADNKIREVIEDAIGNDRLLAIFKDAIEDELTDSKLRDEITRILGEIAPHILAELEETSALIPLLYSQDEKKQYNAALTFCKVRDPQAIPALLDVLNKSKFWAVRHTALTALENHGWKPSCITENIACMIARRDWENLKRVWSTALPQILECLNILKDNCHALSYIDVKRFIELCGLIGDQRAIQGLVGLLESEEIWIRRSAVIALGNIGSSMAFEALQNCSLIEEDWLLVLESLGKIGDRRAILLLITSLHYPNEHCQRVAAGVLKNMNIGEKYFARILEMLQSPKWWQRRGAAIALGELAFSKAHTGLMQIVEDENTSVATAAIEAMGKIGDKSVTSLLAMAENKNHPHQRAIVEALSNTKSQIARPLFLKILKDKDNSLVEIAIEALGKLRDKSAIPMFLKMLKRQDSKHKIIAALGDIGDAAAISPILEGLRDKDQKIVEAALIAAGKLKDRQAVPIILEILQEGGEKRIEAIEALGNIGDATAVPILIKILQGDNSQHSIAAANALGNLKAIKAVSALANTAKDANRFLREAAIRALGHIRSKTVIVVLRTALQDVNRSVREASLEALANLADKRAIADVIPFLREPDANFRKLAIAALQKMDWQPSCDEEEITNLIARQQWDQVAKFGEKSVSRLIEIIKTWEGSNRIEAAKALVTIDISEERRSEIREMIAGGNPDIEKIAILIAGKIKDTNAIPVLTKIATQDTNEELRQSAKRALNCM